MKKFIFIFLIFTQISFAQENNSSDLGKNEIKFDVVSLVALGKIHVSYERFISNDFSVGLSGNFNQSKSREDDFENGKNRTLEEYQIIPFVRYSLSKSQIRYYFVEVFVSANQGKYRELERLLDQNNNAYYQAVQKEYSDFAVGAAVGHKFYIKEKFGIDIFVGMGKNLFSSGESPDIISRVGVNLGYRF
ncbi:DUF3575 domain-containing protein [Flavobacterium azooxidireducens]|uniref:DUF3575 domain-containing protein n=1 Tax=Flavobacterium azooxidireducens TaxID=1871076 RepID=A0ABY4KE58_9FLAO|nr:DUF3575 domain-containing protein [Flavobacterium azooxidireducens]UPQ79086.1 DUF3575 domain-containing protein [Flavobacterium azooxidireducens]